MQHELGHSKAKNGFPDRIVCKLLMHSQIQFMEVYLFSPF